MALRRDRDRGDWTTLPIEGRQGPPPDFPLSRPSRRELTIWEGEWRKPQAVMWEARGQQLEVALYVRAVVVAEGRKATASDRALPLRYMDDLGLSQGGLAKNRWRIAAAAPERTLAPTGTAGRPSVRDRLKVVDGGG
jgi:hypothetical protein